MRLNEIQRAGGNDLPFDRLYVDIGADHRANQFCLRAGAVDYMRRLDSPVWRNDSGHPVVVDSYI